MWGFRDLEMGMQGLDYVCWGKGRFVGICFE